MKDNLQKKNEISFPKIVSVPGYILRVCKKGYKIVP